MKFLLLTFLALLYSTFSSFSQTIPFQKVNGLAGNNNLSYVIGDQNGNLYAVANDNFDANGFIYRSQNGGVSWQKLNFTCSYARIAPNGTLFGIKSNALSRSVNQGQTWTLVNTSFSAAYSTLEILPSGTLLYATYNTLLRSTDNGTSWTEITVPFTGVNKIFSGNDGSVYAFLDDANSGTSGQTKVYRSTDDGQTWPLVSTYPDDILDYGLYFQTQSGRLMILNYLFDGFYYSDDHGSSWIKYPQNGAGSERPVSIMQMPSGRIWLVTALRRFYSDDDGTTWIVGSPSPFDDPLKGLYSTPDGNVWGNFDGSLYRASDMTLEHWNFAADGMNEPNVLQIHFIDDNNLYVATSGGLFRSSDGGAHWTHFYQEPIYSDYDFYDARFCIDRNGQIVLADGFRVWRIDPQTGTRTNITPPDNQPMYNRLWTTFCLPNGDLLVGEDPINTYISTDNGNNWTLVNDLTMPKGMEVVTDTLVYLYPDFGIPYAYNPLTATSQRVEWNYEQYPTVSGMDLGPSGSIHVTSYNRHCVSYDFGASWECHENTNDPFFAPHQIVVNSAGYIFTTGIIDGRGIYESVDGGLSWNVIYKYPSDINVTVTNIHLSPAERIYAAVYGKGLYRSANSTASQALIKGSVFDDVTTADCNRDITESGVVRVKTKLAGNGSSYVGVSNLYGQYTMPASTGNLTAEAIPPSNYWAACQKSLTVAANATGVVTDSLALGLKPLVQCPKMEVSLSSPFLRRCFDSYLTVDYCNTGTLPATNATVEVTLDSFFVFESATASLLAQNGQKLTFQIGDVGVNRCGQFKIFVTVSCEAALGQTHCSSAHIYPDQDCANTWTGSWLETSAECTDSGLVLTIHNRGAAMQTPTTYIATRTESWTSGNTSIIEQGSVQLPADGTFTLTVPALDDVVFFSVVQEDGFPYGTFTGLLAEGCGSDPTNAPFYVHPYANTYGWEDEECVVNRGSFDPNDKSAFPPGFGAADYLPHGQTIEYQIRFQNTGTDTAFTVVVRDQLSPWLDLTTIRPIAASQPYLFEINGQELVFRFPHVNLPDSNINEAASHGFLRFTIAPRTELPDGIEITNQARIYFDFNDPVITNTTHYTLGVPFVTNTKESYSLPALTVSPNPSSGLALIELPASIRLTNGQMLHVTDMAGREIYQQPMEGNRTEFHLPQLASGLYLLAVRAKDGQIVAAGKWVKN